MVCCLFLNLSSSISLSACLSLSISLSHTFCIFLSPSLLRMSCLSISLACRALSLSFAIQVQRRQRRPSSSARLRESIAPSLERSAGIVGRGTKRTSAGAGASYRPRYLHLCVYNLSLYLSLTLSLCQAAC